MECLQFPCNSTEKRSAYLHSARSFWIIKIEDANYTVRRNSRMLEGSLRGTISRTKKGGRGVEYTTLSQTTIRFDVQPSPEGGRERERGLKHTAYRSFPLYFFWRGTPIAARYRSNLTLVHRIRQAINFATSCLNTSVLSTFDKIIINSRGIDARWNLSRWNSCELLYARRWKGWRVFKFYTLFRDSNLIRNLKI